MGFFGRIKLLGRKRGSQAVTHAKTKGDVSQEEKESASVVIRTPQSDPDAERELPSLLWDAAHSPEVLSIKTSLLRDPTARGPSFASSTAVGASSFVSSFAIPKRTNNLRIPNKLFPEDFESIRRLGAGGCGTVYLVRHVHTGKELAMKVINKRYSEKEQVLGEQAGLREVGTRGVPTIMEFLGSFHNKSHYFLLTEHYSGGDLAGLIDRWGGRVPVPLTKFYSGEIACGLKFLHDLGLVHLDVKPENILIKHDKHCVISDLGFTKPVLALTSSAHGEPEASQPACGTLCYMSPEMFYGEGEHFSSDVWSFAVTVFSLLMGRTPWEADDHFRAMFNLRIPFKKWLGEDYMDKQSKKFLSTMFVIDPARRATLEEAMDHPWWGKPDWNALASGTAPIPDVGSPPEEHEPVFRAGSFGCFGASDAYTFDPCPEFFYASSALAVAPRQYYDADDDDLYWDDNRSTPYLGYFENVPLEGGEDGPFEDESVPPVRAATVLSDPVQLDKSFVTATTAVAAEDKSKVSGTSVGVEVMVREKPAGLFARAKSWLSTVASRIARLCTRISCL